MYAANLYEQLKALVHMRATIHASTHLSSVMLAVQEWNEIGSARRVVHKMHGAILGGVNDPRSPQLQRIRRSDLQCSTITSKQPTVG